MDDKPSCKGRLVPVQLRRQDSHKVFRPKQTSPYFIVDISGSFTWKKFTFGLAVENLFNTKWREAQFATETLIPGDSQPVTDICFTPGTPFSLRGSVAFKF